MTLDDIGKKTRLFQTIMSADQEIQCFGWLMQIPIHALRNDWATFDRILCRLSESHTDTFYEITAINKMQFIKFAAWLDQMAEEFEESNRKAALRQVADHFRIDPQEMKG